MLAAMPIFGQGILNRDVEEDEVDTFRAFLERKETDAEITDTGIRFGGDVRAKYFHENKRTNGFKTRGTGAANPVNVDGSPPILNINRLQGERLLAQDDDFYEIEANLEVEYVGCRDWAEIRLRFRNVPGIEFGTGNGIKLTRAWLGYNVYGGDFGTVDIEAGRYGMGDIFESKIEFDTDFDGLLFTYGKKIECVGDFFIHGGPFVINYRSDHYGWVGETALLDVADTGLYLKYSFINWRKLGPDFYSVQDSPNFRFANSQALIGYRFKPCSTIIKRARLYAAYLINHVAKTERPFIPRKDNRGWYAGVELGMLDKAGDWLFDINYQYVGYLAVPQFDVAGGSRGNRGSFDTNVVLNPSDPLNYVPFVGVVDVPFWQLHGNSNYQGWVGTAYYQLTDQLTLKAAFKSTTPVNKNIGGGGINANNIIVGPSENVFRRFEFSAIYDF